MSAAAEQRSAEWLFLRAGKVTASRFHDVVARGKRGDYLAGRESYLWELVIERLTEAPTDHYTSTAMQWGIDSEAAARMAYEVATGAFVESVGFVPHEAHANIGGSPDGLVGEDGGIEIKCPYNSAVHLQCFLDGMPEEHRAQVQGCMWLTGRAWWDFVSHDVRLPEPFTQYRQRIARDEAYIAMMREEVIKFDAEVTAMVNRIRFAAGVAPQPVQMKQAD